MGVSLERVQFKFASIIGELCNEPFILSQFAVWLDLRLAEYKLQGAISLECSNERPDPDWLKGVKDVDIQLVNTTHVGVPPGAESREIIKHNPHRSKTKAFGKSQVISGDYGNVHDISDFKVHEKINPEHQNLPQSMSLSASVSSSPHHHPTTQSIPEIIMPESLESQVSPEVVVKVEPTDEDISIFPVTLHPNEGDQNSFVSPVRRKRRVSATDNSSLQTNINDQALFTAEDNFSSETHKASKFASPSSHSTPFQNRGDDSLSFQSFMSTRESFDSPGTSVENLEANSESLIKGNNSASADKLDKSSTILSCWVCGRIAPSDTSLQEHFNAEHMNTIFDCFTCARRLTIKELPQHQMMQHKIQEALKCPACSKVFQKKRYLKEHMRMHAPKPERRCFKCGELFTWRASLNKHLKKCQQGQQDSE